MKMEHPNQPTEQPKKRQSKKLKLWNGRLYHYDKANGKYLGHKDPFKSKLAMWTHCYVCATSEKQIVEMFLKIGIHGVTLNEIRVYWSKGCWGNPMDGVTPEIGIWASHDIYDEKPTRLL
jgi:hypothetical protein